MEPHEIGALLSKLIGQLPHEDARIWSCNGDEILCETEQTAETIADFFDAIYGFPTVNTGYYDPEEDARNGETDASTGYYYVTIN